MRAVQFDRFGPPEVMQLVDLPVPDPGPGEVLVRVHAAGVNFFEVLMRADCYAVTPELPMHPGVEVVGVVEGLGRGSDPALLGARVAVPLFMAGRSGGYAEFVTVDAASVVHLPDTISCEDAAALMVQGLTALHLVRRSPPKGKIVLVDAAAGGVGSLLLQLAKSNGAAMVIAAAGSAEKRALTLSLGADLAIDYTEAGWQEALRTRVSGRGADIIYEMVGGEVAKASLDALAPCGELVFAAMGRFSLERADIEAMLGRNQSLKGFSLLPLLSGEGVRRDLAGLFDLAAAGALTIIQGGRFSLHQAAQAHRAVEERRVSGKVVLVP
ncbi:quinone oxidoreductase family protein [Rhizobium binxianense]